MGIVSNLVNVVDEANEAAEVAEALGLALEDTYDLAFAKSFAVRAQDAHLAFAKAAVILAASPDVTVTSVGTYPHDDGFDLYITVE